MPDSAIEPPYTFVEKSFITAMDTEIESRYGKWFDPPVKEYMQFMPIMNIIIISKLHARKEINQ